MPSDAGAGSRPARRILALDTSGRHCAATLLCDDAPPFTEFEATPRGQAERLMPLLEELLARAGIAWADLDALAVGTGPGNFTGLRVGVAATRGLALALAIPAIGATGFEAMALDLPRPLRVVIPAGRGMVHVQDFPADAPPRAAARLSIDDLPHFGGRVVGALARDDGMAPPDAGEAGGTIRARYPLTEAIARIARTRLAQPGYVQGPRPAPFYLRGPDAHPSTRRPPPIIDA